MNAGFSVGWLPTSTDPRVASVRIRCLKPLRELQRRGCNVALAERQRHYDVLVLSKRYDAATLQWAAAARAAGSRIVLDLCDNHFHVPQPDARLQAHAAQLRSAVQFADAVSVSTPALGDIVTAETNVRPAAIIGDAVEESFDEFPFAPLAAVRAHWQLRQLRRWLAAQNKRGATPLLWFGAAAGPYGPGGMRDLRRIRACLDDLHREHPISLTVISNSRPIFEEVTTGWGFGVFYLDWTPYTIQAAMRAHAVAVLPITPTPFTVAKSNNRVATALWNGLAVVADAIPSYLPFRQAIALDEWESGLRRYVADARTRAAHIKAGQALVTQQCMIGPVANDWMRLFETVAAASANGGGPQVAAAGRRH